MSVETPSAEDSTDVIAMGDLSSPVFVDATGRRGKRIRVIFGVLGAATLVYGALVATSLAGGPLEPQQLLPFPDLVNNLPVLDPQQPVTQPGANGTPAANRAPVTQAKKITNNKPSQIGAVPVPSGVPITTTAPAGEATTTPAAEGTNTDAPPSTQPSKSPTPSTKPSTKPSGKPSLPPPSVEPTEGATSTGAVKPPLGTDQVGETTTGRPGVSPMVSSSGTTSGTGGTVASPSATASLGPA
ncbi:hypothetical protein AB0M46_21845 [Dactylosporangium sp. NPDC051485]|uniref:hypothetical protein n=1 Tax=Dactylosporangium sp. NPDC051485 TaxID=3154846 RepID=UPI003418BBEE